MVAEGGMILPHYVLAYKYIPTTIQRITLTKTIIIDFGHLVEYFIMCAEITSKIISCRKLNYA